MRAAALVALARRPALAVALALLACALAWRPAGRLELSADLVGLLPDGSPAASAYRVFLERFGGEEKVFVLILPEAAGGAETADLVDAAELLEEELAGSPEVASARAGPTADDESFFLHYVAPRAPLLLEGDWLGTVRRRVEPAEIRRRVTRLKAALSTPAGSARALLARSDPLGFTEELGATSTPGALPLDPLTSTFLSPAGDAALVVVTPARAEMDPAGGRALLAELDTAFERVRRSSGAGLELRAVGGPLYAAQDEALLRRDLQRTLAGSLLATAAILVLAFEGLLLPLAALAPLVVGLFWAAGWMGLVHGEVAGVSVGFGAVLVGLGIDYGIHAGARFRQSFHASGDAGCALSETVRHAGPGIATSALTTAAGFGVLGFAHFRPLSELASLVALGILSILAAVVLLGGAALVVVGPRLRRPAAAWRLLGRAVERSTGFATRRPKLVLASAAGLSALALWAVAGLDLDADLRALRPADRPAAVTEALLAEHFGLGADTAHVVVRGGDLGEALEAAGTAAGLLRRALGDSAEVSSPSEVLTFGEPAAERLRELGTLDLGAAADLLEAELVAQNLDPRSFARGLSALRAFDRGEDPGAPPEDAWPDWLAASLVTGAGGAWASVGLRLPAETWPDGPPADLLAALETAVPGSAVASATALGREVRALAGADLRRLGLLALLAIAAVVLASFGGRPRDSLMAIVPVALGSLLTLGLWAALGRSLDLFSLAVLPILLGIGIDDGLHVVHGARRDRAAGILGSARAAGRALVLTTLTTGAGFASLTLSTVPALRNGGLLIATGVFACLLATLLVLPAIEALAREVPTRAEPPRAPQAPDHGPMRRWLGSLHVTGIFWYRLHRWGMTSLPEWSVGPVITVCTTFFFLTLRRSRIALADNLVPVLGPCGWWRRQRRAYRIMHNFAWVMSERYERLSPERRESALEIEGEEHWRRAGESPEGLILVTAHVGHWEVGSMLVPGRHVHVVREEELDPKAQEFLRGLYAQEPDSGASERSGGFTMHFARDDPAFGLKLMKALRRGEWVALQGDRPRSVGRTCETELFGRPFELPAGPAALARGAGVALQPVFVFRAGRLRSRVVFRPPIRVEGRGHDALCAAMQRIAADVEWAIREEPYQWFCFRNLWGSAKTI